MPSKHNQIVRIEPTPISPTADTIGEIAAYVDADGVAKFSGTNDPLPVSVGNSLVPEKYDDIALTYTGNNLTTVVYSFESILIATLTLTYVNNKLTHVARS